MTDKFLGCILSIKTKPSPTVQNVRLGVFLNKLFVFLPIYVKSLILIYYVFQIIGTVRKIELNPTSQALILDDAMANGTVLNDGFVVMWVDWF